MKHGRKISWNNIFVDKPKENNVIGCEPKIQKVLREDGTYTIQVYMKHSPPNKKCGSTCYEPSLFGFRALLNGMMEIYGKAEVERELGIKIE